MNLPKNKFFKQSFRYMITGGISFCSDYAIYWIFSSFWHYQIATYMGLITGLIVNYVMSKQYVFEQKRPATARQIFLFAAFTALGFALTGLGMYLGVERLRMNDKLMKFIVAVLVFIMNFLARKWIIFKEVE